jgi:hypothetical protein
MIDFFKKKWVKIPLICLLVLTIIYSGILLILYNDVEEKAIGRLANRFSSSLGVKSDIDKLYHFMSFEDVYCSTENHFYYIEVNLSGNLMAKNISPYRDKEIVNMPFHATVRIGIFDDYVVRSKVENIKN